MPYDTYRLAVDFCYAYHDFEQKLEDLDGMHSHEQDGMPRGTDMGNPTEKEAIRRMNIEQKLRIIEEAVEQSVPEEEYGAILKYHVFLGVTKRGITHKYLVSKLGMPCDKDKYSDLRRQVYWRVAERIM